jgi:hypothetical protein
MHVDWPILGNAGSARTGRAVEVCPVSSGLRPLGYQRHRAIATFKLSMEVIATDPMRGYVMRAPAVSRPESRTWRISLTGDAPDGTTLSDTEELRTLLGSKCQLITVKAPIRQEPKKARFSGLFRWRRYGSERFSLGWTWNSVKYSSGQSVEEAMESAAHDFLNALARTEQSEWTIRRIEGWTSRRWWRTSTHVQVRITPGGPFPP